MLPARQADEEADTTREPTRAHVGAPPVEELVEALARHQGNLAAVGREYEKKVMTVRRWLARHGLHPEDFRPS